MHMGEDVTPSLEQEQETEVTRISSEWPEVDSTQSDPPYIEVANYTTVVSVASSIVKENLGFTVEISSEIS